MAALGRLQNVQLRCAETPGLRLPEICRAKTGRQQASAKKLSCAAGGAFCSSPYLCGHRAYGWPALGKRRPYHDGGVHRVSRAALASRRNSVRMIWIFMNASRCRTCLDGATKRRAHLAAINLTAGSVLKSCRGYVGYCTVRSVYVSITFPLPKPQIRSQGINSIPANDSDHRVSDIRQLSCRATYLSPSSTRITPCTTTSNPR